MGMVEWMTAVLLVRPVAVEIGRLLVLGRSAWSKIRSGHENRAGGEGRPRLQMQRDHDVVRGNPRRQAHPAINEVQTRGAATCAR
jgi:hypothetical protein